MIYQQIDALVCSKQYAPVYRRIKVEIMHNNMVLWEQADVLEDLSSHEVSFDQVVEYRVLQKVAWVLVVVEQSVLDGPWILDANVAEGLAVEDFLALEEVILLLVLESVE